MLLSCIQKEKKSEKSFFSKAKLRYKKKEDDAFENPVYSVSDCQAGDITIKLHIFGKTVSHDLIHFSFILLIHVFSTVFRVGIAFIWVGFVNQKFIKLYLSYKLLEGK